MYIANRELELSNRKAKPGEQVPEVLTWSYPVLLAHLNMGWIKYVGDGADAHQDDQQNSSPALKENQRKVADVKNPSPVSQEASTEAIPTKEKKTKKKPEVLAPAEGDFKCEECGKTFKTARALKIHVTTAHKK